MRLQMPSTLLIQLLVGVSLLLTPKTVTANINPIPFSLVNSSEVTPPAVFLSGEERKILEGYILELDRCCKEGLEIATGCKDNITKFESLIKLQNKHIEQQNIKEKILNDQFTESSKRIAELESNSWFETIWDWGWPITAVVLGGIIYGQQMGD